MRPLATRLTALVALLFAAATVQAQNPQVTFQLDAATLLDACQIGPDSPNPDAYLSLRGNFNDYSERGDELTDEDGDGIYTVTVTMAPGDYDYKFYHSEIGWEDGVEGSTHPDGNRQLTVTDAGAQTVEPVAYNKTFDAICGAQNAVVTFQLDAATLLGACQLGPDSPNPEAFVSVRGNFNGYGEDALVFADEDGDGLYTASTELLPGDYDFKLYHSGLSWEDPTEGSTHPDGNRQFTLGAETELTVGPMQFNRGTIPSICGSSVQCVDAFFRVNMGPQIAAGEFDPALHLVTVAGPHVGWSTTADTLQAELRDPNLYSTLVTLDAQTVPGEIEYKFVSGTLGETPGGWEAFNGNRFLPVTGDEADLDGNGCIDVTPDPVPFFNNTGWGDLFSQDVTVTVEVDARPAYYFLADSSYVPGGNENLPIDRLEGFETMFINGPLAGGWENNWSPTGLGSLDARRLNDAGENGDAVAGDSIFTWQVQKAAGSSRSTTFKFGLDGYDNENAGGADHRLMIPDDANPVVRVVFGAARQSEGEYSSTLYYPYIAMQDGLPVVVRRGGDIVDTAVEPGADELPARVALGANYPNPFNPATSFEYRLDAPQPVLVRVFDLTGRVVATLVDGPQAAGTHRVSFDASGLASGMYLYQLRTPAQLLTRTMVLVK